MFGGLVTFGFLYFAEFDFWVQVLMFTSHKFVYLYESLLVGSSVFLIDSKIVCGVRSLSDLYFSVVLFGGPVTFGFYIRVCLSIGSRFLRP